MDRFLIKRRKKPLTFYRTISRKKKNTNIYVFCFKAREFMCDACAMNFRTLKTLQNHQIREHHDELQGVKKYKCSFCDKMFRFPAHLISHERVHTKEKPYKCEKCGKGFSVKCNLMMHMETHKNVDERKFKCTQVIYF